MVTLTGSADLDHNPVLREGVIDVVPGSAIAYMAAAKAGHLIV